ncbi:hypothetical protein [Halomontanus rarus]|uniref:hypothetical protein n=1 Tax=Halomontanus rarus TaxID=3034020 RepID=UPI001A99CABC
MSAGSSLTAVGFWVGSLLPFVYLPVFATGIDSASRLLLFVGFIALNVVALVVGHDYPETRSR